MYNIKAFLNDISINKMCVILEKIQPAKIYNKGDFIFHKENIFYIYYTQDYIAKRLGLSRPTVNKTLSFFKNQNWLETKYSYISILNLQAIENFLI